MNLTPETNKELIDLENKYNDRKLLWSHVDKFAKLYNEWYNGNF